MSGSPPVGDAPDPRLTEATDSPTAAGASPPLLANRSFWGLLVTQFLGAFNDNLFKQIILLLATPVAIAAMQKTISDKPGLDVQGWANMVFSLPFVIFSGFAGYLSDRYPKRRVIISAKVAEVVIMGLGMLAFMFYDWWGMAGTWCVLALMGTHSAFFGPGKYGILPELFTKKDLPKANGLILMTTFLAIIFGTVVAGILFERIFHTSMSKAVPRPAVLDGAGMDSVQPSRLWLASAICLAIAVVGTWTSTWIRRTPAAQPEARMSWEDWGLALAVRELLWRDRPLLRALLVSCVFWMVSGIVLPTVNRLGLSQLQVASTSTSLLTAATALGIMAGSVLAAVVFKGWSPTHQVSLGLGGMVVTLVLLGGWLEDGQHWLGYLGCFLLLLLLGGFAAIYAVPLQVFLQDQPPAALKGRMIGTMNQANFVGILLSGPLYQALEAVASRMGWPISSLFWMLALFLLPLAVRYRLGQ
jgi:MFS family permease